MMSFLDRISPDPAAYDVPPAWRAGGQLDSAALRRALEQLTARNEPLRTALLLALTPRRKPLSVSA